MTPKPDFKGTLLFNVEYLNNRYAQHTDFSPILLPHENFLTSGLFFK